MHKCTVSLQMQPWQQSFARMVFKSGLGRPLRFLCISVPTVRRSTIGSPHALGMRSISCSSSPVMGSSADRFFLFLLIATRPPQPCTPPPSGCFAGRRSGIRRGLRCDEAAWRGLRCEWLLQLCATQRKLAVLERRAGEEKMAELQTETQIGAVRQEMQQLQTRAAESRQSWELTVTVYTRLSDKLRCCY